MDNIELKVLKSSLIAAIERLTLKDFDHPANATVVYDNDEYQMTLIVK